MRLREHLQCLPDMSPRTCSLELIHRTPSKRMRKPALLFVHGAYVGAWCWDVHFLRYLAECGFPSYALSLRGHGASGCDREFSMLGIDDYVADVERVVAYARRVPVLIGHSMGGLVVARLLGRSAASNAGAPGAVLMAPVPMTGLIPAVSGVAMHAPMLLLEMNQVQLGQAWFERASPTFGAHCSRLRWRRRGPRLLQPNATRSAACAAGDVDAASSGVSAKATIATARARRGERRLFGPSSWARRPAAWAPHARFFPIWRTQ